MTNIDRATEIIAESITRDSAPAHEIVADLEHDGLLMPDLPEPTRWKQHEEPEWDACYTTVTPAGYEGRVIVEDSDEKWEASAGDIRALALAMLAAADYVERNQE